MTKCSLFWGIRESLGNVGRGWLSPHLASGFRRLPSPSHPGPDLGAHLLGL